MNRKEMFPVWVVTGLLLLNCLLIYFTDWLRVIYAISLIGPFLIIWMAYNVLKHGRSTAPDMPTEDEWGYADKEKKDLGSF